MRNGVGFFFLSGEINPAPFFFSLGFLFLVFAPAFAAGVTVKTAADGYAAGQPVEITLTNGSGESVYSLAKSTSPGMAVRNLEVKNPRGIWDAFLLKSRKGGDSDFQKAGQIKPGENVTFSWVPLVLEQGREIAPAAGKYRLTVIYHSLKGSLPIFGTAKSNEFTIK